MGPLDHVAALGNAFDDLGVPWVLGGSLASSLLGEPRSTNDVDIAVRVAPAGVEPLVARVDGDYLAPLEALTDAARRHDWFNLLHHRSSFKVDLFFLGDVDLDQLQIERRQLVEVPGLERPIWVTSPEDVLLRKLWWYQFGGVSDRQWNDVLSVLRVQRARLDVETLRADADRNGLRALLDEAIRLAAG